MTVLPAPSEVALLGGASRRLVVHGAGTTVVFVNGLGTPLEEWWPVAELLADRVRVVLFDRPAARGLVGADAAMADLEAVLAHVGTEEPVVLVGHSYGGLLVRLYAARHPSLVAAGVLVDPTPELLAPSPVAVRFATAAYGAMGTAARFRWTQGLALHGPLFGDALPADVAVRVRALASRRTTWRTAQAELRGVPAVCRAVTTAGWPDGVPLVVLSAGGTARRPAADRIVAAHRAHATASNGRHEVVGDSGHYISLDQPAVVADAIRRLLPS